jgi:hypothetical protein
MARGAIIAPLQTMSSAMRPILLLLILTVDTTAARAQFIFEPSPAVLILDRSAGKCSAALHNDIRRGQETGPNTPQAARAVSPDLPCPAT